MSKTASAGTTWPSRPPHRHRRAEPPRRRLGIGRLLFSLLALAAGILALNAVIQAAAASGQGPGDHGVDIASLLPPAAAAEEPLAAGPAATVDTTSADDALHEPAPPTTVAHRSQSRPAQAVPTARAAAPRATAPKAAAAAPPAAGRTKAAAPAASSPGSTADDSETGRDTSGDDDSRPAAASGSDRDSDQTGDDGQDATEPRPAAAVAAPTSTPAPRDRADRPARTLLPHLKCTVDRIKVAGKPILRTGPGC